MSEYIFHSVQITNNSVSWPCSCTRAGRPNSKTEQKARGTNSIKYSGGLYQAGDARYIGQPRARWATMGPQDKKKGSRHDGGDAQRREAVYYAACTHHPECLPHAGTRSAHELASCCDIPWTDIVHG